MHIARDLTSAPCSNNHGLGIFEHHYCRNYDVVLLFRWSWKGDFVVHSAAREGHW